MPAKQATEDEPKIVEIDNEQVSAKGLRQRILPKWFDLNPLVERLTVPYFVYCIIASMFFGIWIAPAITGVGSSMMDHSAHSEADHAAHEMMQTEIDVPAASAPTVALEVTRDTMSGWNVVLDTERFTFSVDNVNGEHVPNEGHGHIYINGERYARIYGNAVHLPALPEGEVSVSVTLNANDHSIYTVDGEPIADNVVVTNEG
ncbi:MAG: hypothetical protein AAGG69_12460 [Pseudomonadota bacterium]